MIEWVNGNKRFHTKSCSKFGPRTVCPRDSRNSTKDLEGANRD